MTFEMIRIILMVIEVDMESGIDDFKVIMFSSDPLYMSKAMLYKDIPECFNCKVHGFDIDLDNKIIFIKSELHDIERTV